MLVESQSGYFFGSETLTSRGLGQLTGDSARLWRVNGSEVGYRFDIAGDRRFRNSFAYRLSPAPSIIRPIVVLRFPFPFRQRMMTNSGLSWPINHSNSVGSAT